MTTDQRPSKSTELYIQESFASFRDLKLNSSLYVIVASSSFFFIAEVGMNTILTVYIVEILRMDQNIAISVVMIYRCLASNLIIVVAFLADNFFGKFPVLISGSIIYMISLILFASVSVPHFEIEFLVYVALILRGLGIACVQACMVPFANDQMRVPYIPTRKVLTFYLYLILGSSFLDLSSAVLTPYLKDKISCFGRENCYPASFAYCLMQAILGFFIFITAYKKYIFTKPIMAVTAKAPCVIGYALYVRRKRSKKGEKKEAHWLDYAKDKYDHVYIEELKLVIKVLLSQMFLFWTLQHQRYIIWTIQATRTTRNLGNINVSPEQVQAMYPFFILVLAPIYYFVGRPLLTRYLRSPLLQMTLAGYLVALAFALSAIVSYATELDNIALLNKSSIILFMINGRNCTVDLKDNGNFQSSIQPYSHNEIIFDKEDFKRNKIFYKCNEDEEWSYRYLSYHPEIHDYYYYIIDDGEIVELPNFKKMKDASSDGTLIYCLCDRALAGHGVSLDISKPLLTNRYDTCSGYLGPSIRVTPGENYGLKVNDTIVVKNFDLHIYYGTVIILLIHGEESALKVERLKVLSSIHVSFLWMIPQYLLLSASSIIFMLAVFVFQYNETPASCLSLVWSIKHFNSGLDSAALATSSLIIKQSFVLLLWAVGSFVYVLIFGLLVTNYKYSTVNPNSPSTRIRTHFHPSIMYN